MINYRTERAAQQCRPPAWLSGQLARWTSDAGKGGIVAGKLFAWEVGSDGKPRPAASSWPQLEVHLEDWITNDVSLVDPSGLLYLGRQIPTDVGTTLDVLAIDAAGNLAVLELKRERSPREMVAQALEYVAWAATLSDDDILALGANVHGSKAQFRAKFEALFKTDFPGAGEMNREQRILLVAPEFSETVLRVARYLASQFGVPISAVSFGLYEFGANRLLVRSAVVQEDVEPRDAGSRRAARRSLQELLDLAEERGTRGIVDELLRLRDDLLSSVETTQTTISLRRSAGRGRYLSGLSIHPGVEGQPGALINVSRGNLQVLFGLDADELIAGLPRPKTNPWEHGWVDWAQALVGTRAEAAEFVERYLAAAAEAVRETGTNEESASAVGSASRELPAEADGSVV